MKVNILNPYQRISRSLIVKLFLPSLFLLFSFTPVANNCAKNLPVIRKELKIDNAFQSIHIEGDISVILTNDPAGTIIIEGKENDVNKIKTGFKNNILIVNGERKKVGSKLTIYLSAITLRTVQLNGDGNIYSNDFITSDHLHLSLNGNINVKVKTMGQLSFDATDDIELTKKRESRN